MGRGFDKASGPKDLTTLIYYCFNTLTARLASETEVPRPYYLLSGGLMNLTGTPVKKEKNGYVEIISEIFEKIGAWSYDQRWLVFIICLFILGVTAYFASRVRFDNSFESYFARDDAIYDAFLQFREDFGSDEISYIVYQAPDLPYGPWNIDVMHKIDKLTKTLEHEVPFVKEVTSLANVEFIEGALGQLNIYNLLKDFPKTQEDLLKIKRQVLNKPIYEGGLVSRDGNYAAIIIEMEKASIDPLEQIQLDPEKGTALDNLYPQVTHDKIEEILARPEYNGITFFHTGDVPLNATYNRTIESEYKKLSAIAFVVIGLLLALFFRRPIGVIGPLVVVSLAILVTTGFVGLLGWDFDLMFIMLPTILIAVGVANAVHIISEFGAYHKAFDDRFKAIKRTVYMVGVPCLFTSLTTMAGFFSMSVSPIKAIKHFAVYTAMGVAGAFFLSFTLLVVLLSFGRRQSRHRSTDHDKLKAKGGRVFIKALEKVCSFDIRYRWLIIIIFAAVFIFSCLGITRLKVDSNFLNEYSENVEIRKVTEYVDSIMGGTASLSYVFDAHTKDGIMDPKVLREIEALQNRADKEKYIVMKTYSIVDLLKDINKSFHDENNEYYALPETRDAVAQYLLLYEMSGGDELENYISHDYSRANLEIRCKMADTSKYEKLVNDLESYLNGLSPKVVIPKLTGMGSLWLELIDYIVQSQIWGFLLAFVVISIMMCLLFGSFKIGLLAMIPNLWPVIATLGLMGWADMPLDYVKLLIGCVAIGIAVDDTIHLVTRFHHEFLRCRNYKGALFSSMKDVGRALFITSAVLVVGFLIFIFSVMETLVVFGILVAMTIGTAFVADFFLMPALVLTIKPFGPEANMDKTIGVKKLDMTNT
jgi:predicted RND superfamily exporter protein